MFETVSAAVFASLAFIWRREDAINISIKAALTALAIWAVIEALLAWGFILAPIQ